MPPCPPQPVNREDDGATKPIFIPEKSNVAKSKPKMPSRSLAWEINALSAAVMVAVYAALPEDYKVLFYGFLAIVVVDAARYYYFRGSTPGVPYSLPMMSLISMVIFPVRFWDEQGDLAIDSGVGMSTNTLVGKFMVFITDAKICREVMTREGTFQIYAHPNARWLFGRGNLIYMPTEMHKGFRAMLTPALFSNEALTLYAKAQERICRSYLQKIAAKCQETGNALDIRIAFRSMAAAASQESFMGPYLNDTLRQQLEDDILIFTLGFLCFPFPYMGTGLAKAIAAKNRLLDVICSFLPPSREYVNAGNAPRCLLEHWCLSIGETAKEKGMKQTEIPGCSDIEVAMTVMDFLFAAQDATNSALSFAADVLATRPDVIEKVRDEVESIGDKQIWELVRDPEQMQYTCKAANQMLHHKPPVPMIPHLALKETTLAGRNIPKGTILIPSIVKAAQTSGSSDEYNPDGEISDPQFVKTPIFGGGQHKCPGRRYAESLLTVFLAVFLTEYEFERVGPRPRDIMYYPTLFPSVNNFILRPRETDEI